MKQNNFNEENSPYNGVYIAHGLHKAMDSTGLIQCISKL